jgi:hypothetical protein
MASAFDSIVKHTNLWQMLDNLWILLMEIELSIFVDVLILLIGQWIFESDLKVFPVRFCAHFQDIWLLTTVFLAQKLLQVALWIF